MPFLQWILLLFGLISIIIYSLIILTIRRQRSNALLGGSFFRIVEIQYYSELLFFIEFTVSMRLRKYSDLYTYFEPGTTITGIIPTLVSGFHYYIKIVVYIGYITFAINRLTSALKISSYNSVNISVWTPQLLRNIQIIKWTFPLLCVIPTHAWPGFSYWFVVTTSSIRLTNDAQSTELVAYIDGTFCLGTCLFCMVCYIITLGLIRKNWKRVKTNEQVFRKNSAHSTAERSLLISAMLSFLVLTLNTAVQVITIIISWGGATALFFVQDLSYPMIDLMYSHYPWALLVTSGVLRKQMLYDTKVFLRSAFKLDDASVNTIRIGQTVSPATMRTTTNRMSR